MHEIREEMFVTKFFTKENLLSEKAFIAYFVLINLIITLYPYQYGIFRDVFLFLSMSDRLGWGYLEVPPLPPLILALVRFLAGTTFFSLHIIQAVLGSVSIVIAVLMTKQMGGNKFAVILTLICMTFAAQYIGFNSHFDYNTFNTLFWTLCLYFILLLLKTGDKKYWIYFGIAAGLGLLSKITMLYLGFGLLLAFLLFRERRYLLEANFFLSGLIALLLFLPFIIWQFFNGFPILEYLVNYQTKLYNGGALSFLLAQIILTNPVAVLIWVPGLYYFLFDGNGKKYRVLGAAFLIISVLFIVQHAKYYLIAPYYCILFAGGSVFISGLKGKIMTAWLKGFLMVAILITGLISIPLARPVFPPELFIKYTKALGMGGIQIRGEKNETAVLPQNFADQFGWEEMAQKVSAVYNSLSDEEKKKACVFASNYGEAGALHYYRTKYGYPDPICSHNIFYFWGPGDCSGDIVIVVGINEKDGDFLKKYFDSVIVVDRTYNKYAMPFENNPIYLCRGPHESMKDMWKKIKLFI
jgi:hypothetical protein